MKTSQRFQPVNVVLASASSRRQEMLRSLNIQFDIFIPHVRETWNGDKNARRIACELAMRKARKYKKRNALVIGMDTLVVIKHLKLGKPRDPQEAVAMLQMLSGRTHQVITGVALIWKGQVLSEAAATNVEFRRLSPREIDWYVQTGEPFDKAGAYAIQGSGRIFINRIDGCFYNVVGFPLTLFQRLLRRLNLTILDLQSL